MHISIVALILLVVPGGQDDQIQILQKLVHELREEVSELKNQDNNMWIMQQRADENRKLVQDVLLATDTRASLVGDGINAGYDDGVFVMSADGNWKVKINGQLQVRWLYNDADAQPSQHGFEQRRSKIKFSGHIFDPTWTFKITPTWTHNGGSNTEDAWIAKSFKTENWLKFGQFNSKFLRENSVSSSAQLAIERSMVNNAFTYSWTQGLELGWKNDETRFYVQYTDGPNRSNTASLGAPTDAWVVRGELLFGAAGWKDFDSLTSTNGANSGVLVGVAYENYDSNGGTFEYGNANADKSNGWTIDASLRGDGWNILAYAVSTSGENKTSAVEQDSSGWLIQGGFLVSDNTELFAQYQQGDINNAVFALGSNDMSAFRVGFNYWPTEGNNNLKWTTDVAWSQESLADGAGTGISSADWATTGNGWRQDAVNEDGQMLLRTQLQLLF